MRRLTRVVLALCALPPVLAAIYAVSALALSSWAINEDFRPSADGVLIGVSSNGVHANLHLPARSAQTDWTELFPAAAFPRAVPEPRVVSFGWGSRDFYLNVPTWDDFRLDLALTALSGTSDSVLHVGLWPRPWTRDERYVELRVSEAAHARLVAHVRATLRVDATGRPLAVAGYSYHGNDAFFEAHGRYTLFRTCNEWVRSALAAAGVRTGLWTPFPGALLDHLRAVER